MFYAHSTSKADKSDWHGLCEHLTGAATQAGQFAAVFGAEKAANLAGLLHDLGKYTSAFQAKISADPKRRVDHASAGAIEVKTMAFGPQDVMMAQLISFAIAGHHAGLADHLDLRQRLKKPIEPLDPVWRGEINPDSSGLMPAFNWQKDRLAFQLGFLGRMIFSCLVDADYRDTEAFYCRVEGLQKDRDWPALPDIVDQLITTFGAYMARKQRDATASSVNQLRDRILNHVRAQSSLPPGLFTLTVPTGGGKTLTSLAFALDHAKAHRLNRIIYAIPFTSVIDQTATVFREVLGADFILEHHSAIDEKSLRGKESRDKLRLAMEDWAAPIVVTTNVQFFESLFARRSSRCRKLHNIAGSVIILDEAQTIPRSLLRPCLEVLRELSTNYGCTILLCTATQPALDENDLKNGLPLKGRELAPDPTGLAQALKRTQIDFAGEMSDEDLISAFNRHAQGLVIVNSRKHALALYKRAVDAGLSGVLHLTTRQYAAHRREILRDVHRRLKEGEPCRLIATSLVEAGVDLDFSRVWRAQAGLDQIAQAAGRCNREGKRPLEDSVVTVFESPDNPPPAEIKLLTQDFMRMAHKHEDWLSPEAMRDYFGEVFWRLGERLDAENILADFNINEGSETDFKYRSVAKKFRMIESGLSPVIIARDGEAKAALSKLNRDGMRPGAIARALQSYIVQVPPKARALLLANGHAAYVREDKFSDQFCVLQTPGLYRDETGLLWEDADYLTLESTIF